MSLFRARPAFVRDAAASPECVVASIRRALTHGGTGCEGAVATHHLVLRVPINDRHFWSPVLDARVGPYGEGGARVHGTFGPHPHVWTLFIFVRACLIVACTSVTVFACSQTLVHGGSPWWKWAGLAAVAVILEYVGAQIGQRLGNDQIELLERFVDGAIARCEALEIEAPDAGTSPGG